MRYRLSETLKAFGGSRLRNRNCFVPTHEKHLACFLRLAEEAESKLTGPEQAEWLDRLEIEHDNFLASLDWTMMPEANEGAGDGLRLAAALSRFWEVRGHLSEGQTRLAAAIAQLADSERDVPPTLHPVLAKALNGAGNLARSQVDYDAARDLYLQALSFRLQVGDQRAAAASLNNLGLLAHEQGDYEAARRYHEQSLAIERGLGDPWGVAVSLNNLGSVALDVGDFAVARPYLEESLAYFRAIGDRGAIARSLYNLCYVNQKEGHLAEARAYLSEALETQRDLGDKQGVAFSLESFGYIGYAEMRPERAAQLLGAAEALREAIGAPLPPSEYAAHGREVAAVRSVLGDAAFQRAWVAGRAMPLEEAITLALNPGS